MKHRVGLTFPLWASLIFYSHLESFCMNDSNDTVKDCHKQLNPNKFIAPFVFPQLYSCIKSSIPSENEFRSQSREDVWLWENIFEKLPHNESLGGTFLEIGGLDGVQFSNTYFFEKKLDWRGILIEGHPDNRIRNSQLKRSNSAIFTVAICKEKPGNLTFTVKGGASGTAVAHSNLQFMNRWHRNESHGPTVSCIPIQSIIDSTGIIDIDLFSLDVEGAEAAVLETLDFSVTNIRVLLVELDGSNKSKDEKVRSLILSHGFVISNGSINNACKLRSKFCMKNEVFINPHFSSRKRPNQYYNYGTGVQCIHEV
jgi:FkbM family methyltransferase